MPFAAAIQKRPESTGRDGTVVVLDDGSGGRAEVWPAMGFNCYHWQVVRDGRTLELIYAAPDLFAGGRPTRSGIPILFPFPNRIRDGRFTWDGKTYQLPLNGPTKKNAIHGFACYRAWRLESHGADAASAWATGVFRGSVDALDCRDLWPTDYELRVTYRLGIGTLRIEAEVTNPDAKPLPFGLGYHPYFRLPFTAEERGEDCAVVVPARSYWVLEESLPTGERRPVDAARDLNQPRPFGALHVDDVLTDLPAAPATSGLHERGLILGAPGTTLRLLCGDAFRDLVIFTPPTRQAFCVEPYTCVTDAINLQGRGIDAGWLTLTPGAKWTAVVEMRV